MACVTLSVVTPTIPTVPTIPTWVWILAGVATVGGIGYVLVKKKR
jgi:LPXTG-motif cell wall-anchored protein